MKAHGTTFFWPSYADLMTSLFFVMLVLYVLTVVVMQGTLGVDAEKFKQIKEIDEALKELDSRYYTYDAQNKRFRLQIDVNFPSNQADIELLPPIIRSQLVQAGRQLYSKVKMLIQTRKDASYLLVIEGNTQRNNTNYIYRPDIGYELSYKRALALHKLWKDNGMDFNGFENCEILIAGSGYFSKSRELSEEKNRRFTIQITAKVGEFNTPR